jgi:hypothetical protein
VRGIGPRLHDFGVGGVLGDPQIRVYRQSDPPGSPPLAENDDWQDAANAVAIADATGLLGAFALDDGSRDAAVLLDLPAGSYSAHVSGVGGITGTSMVEVYDADAAVGHAPSAELVNISMRSVAGTGGEIVIAGFVVEGDAPRRVLVRAVGPELSQWGVPGVLANPQVRLYQRVAGVSPDPQIAFNDDWHDDGLGPTVADASSRVGAFALDAGSASAALLIWLEPGVYSAHATSGDGSSGVAIVEVYEVP